MLTVQRKPSMPNIMATHFVQAYYRVWNVWPGANTNTGKGKEAQQLSSQIKPFHKYLTHSGLSQTLNCVLTTC